MKRNLIALFFALTVPTVYGATVLSSFLATDPVNGSLQILQVTGAVAGPTAGGLAVADTRTIFYWTPDLAKTLPVSPGYVGSNWPYVFVEGSFSVDASLDPAIFGTIAVVGTGGNLSGDVLTVNGFPVYTRTSHTGPGQTAGIGANWPVIGTNGSAVTTIPEPGSVSLVALGLGAWVLTRRTQRRA